jgi:uncharacterized membrane protein
MQMDKRTYLAKLETALSGLSREERNAAMEYYMEYFDEAGPENEASAMASLGTPSSLAAQIRAEVAVRGLGTEKVRGRERKRSGIGAVWVVVLGIFALPIGLPIAIAVFAVVIAVLIVLFAVLVSLFACVISLLVAGILSTVAGFSLLGTEFATAIFYIGSGFFSIGLAFFLGLLFLKFGRASIHGVAKLFNKIRLRISKGRDKQETVSLAAN